MPKMIEVGDTIRVVGLRNKHATGVVTAMPPLSGDDSLLEYRCDFNKGVHTASCLDCKVIKKRKKTLS